MLRVVAKLGLIFTLMWQLSACGFQLRGADSVGALPFDKVQMALANGVRQDVADALAKQLQTSGVQLVASSDYVIQLAPTNYQTSQTSTTGLGDATSELIKVSQPFTVTDKTGKVVLSGQALSYQDRRIDSASILAADAELKTIQQQMVSDIARQIINRIQRGL